MNRGVVSERHRTRQVVADDVDAAKSVGLLRIPAPTSPTYGDSVLLTLRSRPVRFAS